MEASRKVVKNIFWLALEPGIRVLIAIPLAGFVAHKLGVTIYGEFNYALSFVMLFSVATNLGLSEVLLRTVARHPPDMPRLWSSVLVLKGFLLAAYLTILWGASVLLGQTHHVLLLILLLGLYQGLLSLDNTARAVFGGNQEMKAIAGLGSFKAFAEVAVTVGVLLLGAQALGLAASRVGLGLVGLVGTLWLTWRHFGVRFGRPSVAMAAPLIVPGLSFAVATALWSVNSRAGILILERVRGLDDVGLFTAAMAPVDKIFQFLPAIELALFPFFSSIGDEEGERMASSLSRALRYQAVLSVGLGVCVSVLGPWMIRLVFPRDFSQAMAVLEVLGLSVTVRAVRTLLSTAVGARGGERALAWITGAQCVVTLGLTGLLARSQGAVGLAWALTASETTALVLFLVVLARRHSLSFFKPTAFFAAVAAGIAAYLPYHLVPGATTSLFLPPLFAALYPVLLFAFGAITKEDLGYFAEMARRRAGA
jgi:O-antigen/teichoic acid export membrane protein